MDSPPVAQYCRDVEAYLCRKNDGHLIRVVGPAFDLVSGWVTQGIPLSIAYQGIDRTFERYYRKGPRRRPLRVEFCDADVLDTFDAWRRAVGLPAHSAGGPHEVDEEPRRTGSLPAHLERLLLRLTNLRAQDIFGAELDPILEALSGDLDLARASARGLRGEGRRTMIERLEALDEDLMAVARRHLAPIDLIDLERAADVELAAYRGRMAQEAYDRARQAAIGRLVRDRFSLPIIAFR